MDKKINLNWWSDKKMKLEDATKEELIYWIKQHNFKLREELKNFESDILFYKIERILAEQEKLHKIYKETVIKYNELVKPFAGIPIGDVPQDILDKAIQLQEKMSDLSKKLQKKRKEWEKYNKRYDEILQI